MGKIHYILLFVVAMIFVTVFSYTTSPIYQFWGNTPDSPIFQIIGKYWGQGVIPYRDLWDLKGPFIFLVNAVGYGICGTSLGVYGIQVLSLFFTLCVVYRIFFLHLSKTRAFIFTLFSLLGLSYIYEGGNLTEEYILFPLSLSFYYILKWVDAYEYEKVICHPPLQSVIYGIVLGLSLMSRLTNALGLCAAVAVIATALLLNREHKNLMQNILAFLIGFLIATVPLFAYFIHHNALEPMWNATFLFALQYTKNSTMNLQDVGIHYFLLSYLNCILLMVLVLYMIMRYRRVSVRICLYFLSAIVPFLWFCNSNGFGHYGMIVFPLFCIIMTEMYRMRLRAISYLVILLLIIGSTSKVRFMYIMYHWENKEVKAYQRFLSRTQAIDYTSFVAYNCDPNLYLALGVCPAVEHFALQDFAISRNKRIEPLVISSFLQRKPKWILLSYDRICPHTAITPILNESYHLEREDKANQLQLYKKKDDK